MYDILLGPGVKWGVGWDKITSLGYTGRGQAPVYESDRMPVAGSLYSTNFQTPVRAGPVFRPNTRYSIKTTDL